MFLATIVQNVFIKIIVVFLILQTHTIGAKQNPSPQSIKSANLASTKKNEKKKVTILSLGGGGVKYVMHVTFLRELEKEITRQSGKKIPLYKLFDVVAGTSSGGILATAITTPPDGKQAPYTLEEISANIESDARIIFKKNYASLNGFLGPIYKHDGLKDLTYSRYGYSNLQKPLTNLILPVFDIQENKGVTFTSWQKDASNFKLSDIMLSTSAAPMLFEPYSFKTIDGKQEFKFVDGGFYANQPVLIATTEAKDLYKDQNLTNDDFLIIGLNCFRFREYKKKDYSSIGRIKWAYFFAVFYNDAQVAMSVDMVRKKYGSNFFFWQPNVQINYDIDDFEPETLAYYDNVTKEMIEERQEEFQAMVKKLLEFKADVVSSF